MSYGDELPAFAGLASPAEGYIYCVRKWNKGLSAEPEVVLCANPDVPCSENYSCHSGMATLNFLSSCLHLPSSGITDVCHCDLALKHFCIFYTFKNKHVSEKVLE